MSGIPPMSREMAAVYARQEMAAYAFIRAWMADDVYKGMLLIEQQNIPKESVIFVLSLVKAARRALLSATGYRVNNALEVLDQWLENAGERAS
jgi:hypothetical protein